MEEQFENMSLDELGGVVKSALAQIYRKLRDEEGFGYYQHCSVLSLNEDNAELVIIDDISHNAGIDWPRSWWI